MTADPSNPVVHVLLVDDQAANVLALSEVLTPLALNLVTARSGKEALRHLLDREFALILLDVKMPDLDGIETARLIRQRDKTRHTPIIFLTAYDRDDQQMIQGYSLGAVDFLAKPVVADVLRAKVSVFVDLYRKTEQIRQQTQVIRDTQRKEHETKLAQERQRWEMERLRDEAAKDKKTAERLTAIVAERTRAELLLRQRGHQRALVTSCGQRALAGADLDDLFRDTVLQIAQSMDVDYCVILEWSADHKTLKLRSGVGWREEQHDHAAMADWSDPAALYALKQDQSVVVGNLPADLRFDGSAMLKHGVVSSLTVLLRNPVRPFGVLGVHSRQPRVFTQEDVTFLEAIANVLAASSQRRRSEQELAAVKDQLAEQLAGMTRLHTLSGQLFNSLDLQTIVKEALKALCDLQEARAGALLLSHPEVPGHFTLVSLGLGAGDLGLRQGHTAADWRDPMTFEDVESDPRFASILPALRQLDCRHLHTTPLRTRGGRDIGSVTVFIPQPQRLSESQLRLIDLYARQAAEAIDNARLHQEIQDSNRRKDEFLAMLAHELRNPLAPLRNALEILRSQVGQGMRERARDMAERQVHHMARLVDDLLDVSRISRGKIQLSKQPVELGPIIDRAVESTRLQFEGRGIALAVQVEPGPVWLDGDSTRLEQVLINLLNNAAKYNQADGQVWLSVEREADTVIIRVRDTGIGIAADLLPHVFDMFVQAEGSLDRSQGGLGIGLTLVRSLISLHEGTVEARSAGLGQGSEFTVRLPVLREPPSPPADHATRNGVEKIPCRILIVDDNVDAAESLAFLLRTDAHEVLTAYNGPAALDQARAMLPDVVLLDIGLPGMNGYEVADQLRQTPALRHVKLLALTGYGQEDDRRRSQAAGIDAHLTKPVDLQDLHDFLRSVKCR